MSSALTLGSLAVRDRSWLSRSWITRVLLTAVILEGALMGSGRLLQIGPLTLRMVLYGVCLVYAAFYFSTGAALRKDVVVLVASFTATLAFATAVGLFLGNSLDRILLDVKPLSYFYMLLFFEAAIDSRDRVKSVIRIFKIVGLTLAIAYAIFLVLIFSGIIDFGAAYTAMTFADAGENEFFFRDSNLFFFKGFLFIAVGFCCFLGEKGRWKRLAVMFLFVMIVLTATRGLILIAAIAYIIYWYMSPRSIMNRIVAITLFGALVLAAIPTYVILFGDKAESDETRILITQQISEAVSPASIVIGHGLGQGVEIRDVHMEIAYFEIFHKQGLVGLAWWGCFGYLLFRRYRQVHNDDLARPLMLSSLGVFIMSATNPFMNNPIGMIVLLTSFAALNALREPARLARAA
jgi:hypothetical protein